METTVLWRHTQWEKWKERWADNGLQSLAVLQSGIYCKKVTYSLQDCTKIWGVGLLSVVVKLYSKFLKGLEALSIEMELGKKLWVFRKVKKKLDCRTIMWVYEGEVKWELSSVHCFKKAYKIIEREALWHALEIYGIREIFGWFNKSLTYWIIWTISD